MTTNVLILCTHNSARSVLSDGMLNHLAKHLGGEVRAYIAGRSPSGRINPVAMDVLREAGVDVNDFRSKNWDEFVADGAPKMRIVITVCDSAADEECPYGPGSPVKIPWGYPDPSNTEGGDDKKRLAFELTRQAIAYRMLQLLLLPIDEMTDAELQETLQRLAGS
jgi:arsenate reductase